MSTEKVECTGVSASWCPVCGDCTCPRMSTGERKKESSQCPLHGEKSTHADPPKLTPKTVLRAMLKAYQEAVITQATRLYKVRSEGQNGFEYAGVVCWFSGRLELLVFALGACIGQSKSDFDRLIISVPEVFADYQARLAGERPLDAPPLEAP